jgi:splicing factor U2AF 65 kDa subunit
MDGGGGGGGGGGRRRGGGDRDPYGDDRRRGPRGGDRGGDRGPRGGGGGGGGGAIDREERDLFEQNRRRSASPPPKKREPTPDLTDVVPVTERKRRLTQWDIKPPGYEAVTAEQAKLSGMFPLPGAPRQQAMDPTKLQAFMSSASGEKGAAASGATLKPTNSRQAKRLVVSNLPPSATEAALVDFFNLQLNGLNVIESSDPCLLAQISTDKTFAMVEFRSSGDATVALALDGIKMVADDDVNMGDASNGNGAHTAGAGLKIRRPKDYIVPAIVEEPAGYDPDSDVPLPTVVDSPHKISVTNIPPYLSEDQVVELLVSFGKLKSFVLVKDNGTQESRVCLLQPTPPPRPESKITNLSLTSRASPSSSTKTTARPTWRSRASTG